MNRRNFLKTGLAGVAGMALSSSCDTETIDALGPSTYTLAQATAKYSEAALTANGVGKIKDITMLDSRTYKFTTDIDMAQLIANHIDKIRTAYKNSSNTTLTHEEIDKMEVTEMDMSCDIYTNNVSLGGNSRMLMNIGPYSYPSPTGKIVSSVQTYHAPEKLPQANQLILNANPYKLRAEKQTLICEGKIMDRPVVHLHSELFDTQIKNLEFIYKINNHQDIRTRLDELKKVTESVPNKDDAFLGIQFDCRFGNMGEPISVVFYMPIALIATENNILFGLTK